MSNILYILFNVEKNVRIFYENVTYQLLINNIISYNLSKGYFIHLYKCITIT